jgi:hypothetical protein
LTDYFTDFESESGFEKLLPLATILEQIFIDQSYSLTPQVRIRTKFQILREIQLVSLRGDLFPLVLRQFCTTFRQAPLTDYWTDFESENGFGKVLPLATILVQVVIDQSYSLTLQGPIRTKSQSPDNCMGLQPPGPIIGPILNLKMVLGKYRHWLQLYWYRL